MLPVSRDIVVFRSYGPRPTTMMMTRRIPNHPVKRGGYGANGSEGFRYLNLPLQCLDTYVKNSVCKGQDQYSLVPHCRYRAHRRSAGGQIRRARGQLQLQEQGTVILKEDRIKYWMSVGAKPSGTVHNMLVSAGVLNAMKVNVLPKKTVAKKEEPAAEAAPAAATSPETPVEPTPRSSVEPVPEVPTE